MADCPEWLPVLPEEVELLIKRIKSGKAPGPDVIPPKLIKAFPEWWVPSLAALFTTINMAGVILEAWAKAIVVPVYKKGDGHLLCNYRPISLLSAVGKSYARYLINKLKITDV